MTPAAGPSLENVGAEPPGEREEPRAGRLRCGLCVSTDKLFMEDLGFDLGLGGRPIVPVLDRLFRIVVRLCGLNMLVSVLRAVCNASVAVSWAKSEPVDT